VPQARLHHARKALDMLLGSSLAQLEGQQANGSASAIDAHSFAQERLVYLPRGRQAIAIAGTSEPAKFVEEAHVVLSASTWQVPATILPSLTVKLRDTANSEGGGGAC
jgi:hypothetical protein